ncbi:FIMAH domain-containing protein [Neobacillus niacini]|uniref:FIMAH domain-containing protein n=1 Tax=Neobacillus niacini TaxID=86668 RepID=UPI0005EFFE19|nr:hypothetical protein [Neobacillus niacini]
MKRFLINCLIIWLVVPLFLIEQAQPAGANTLSADSTTYYIDSVNGDDDNNGESSQSAWKSLDKVNGTKFLPGDKILFKAGGKWSGQLHPKGSGAEDRPITIGMYGNGEKPLIQGEGTVESTVYLYNQQYWEIGYLEVTNHSSVPAKTPRRGVHVAAENFEAGGANDLSKVSTLHHIYIHDLYVHDVNGEDKKDAAGSAGIQVSVTIPEGSVQRRTTFDDILIENNVVERVSRSGIITWNDWKYREQLGYGNNESKPWTPLTNVVIRGNKLTDIGGDGIVPHMTDGALVEKNVVDGFNKTSAGYNVGMWTWDGDNTLYQYNEVSGGYSTRDGNAFDFDHGSRGIIYQYNYSHDNDGGTLLVCADGSAKTGGVYDGVFRYNISQNDKYQTFTICGGSNVHNVQIYNNVFYVAQGMKTNMLVSQGGATEVALRNNIFYNLGSGRYTKKSSWTYDHNLFFGNNVPTTSVIPDQNMMTSDPLFVNPGSGDNGIGTLDGYKLQADSPAIGSGTLINNSGSQDFWGTPLSPISQNRGSYGGQAVSITVIRDLLDYYLETGEVETPLYKQLSNKLEQAEQFKNNGQEEQAVKHLKDFIAHLNNNALDKFVSEQSKRLLNHDTQILINDWSEE